MATSKARKTSKGDKVFDVAKPGKAVASASSRPLIIGHKTILKDPMMKEPGVDGLEQETTVKIDQPEADDLPSGSPPVAALEDESAKASRKTRLKAPSESTLFIKPIDDSKAGQSAADDENKIPVKVKTKSAAESAETVVVAKAVSDETAPAEETKDDVAENDKSEDTPTEAEPEAADSDDNADTDSKPTENNDEAAAKSESAGDQPVSSSATHLAQLKAEKANQEAAARKAEIEKLVESREYAIPIGEKTRKKRSLKHVLIGALLIILLGGALTYLMVDVGIIKANVKLPFEFFKDSNSSSPAVETPAVTKKATVKPTVMEESTVESTKAGYLLYTNKTFGVSFIFPKTWGKGIHATKSTGQKGYSVEFARDDDRVIAGAVSRDFEIGADGSCYVVLGLGVADKGFSTNSIKLTAKPTTSKQSNYATTSKLLFKTKDSYATESYEAGKRDGLGACLGAYMNGAKKFSAKAKLPGIDFFFGDNKQQTDNIPLPQLDAYLANPNAFINQSDRNGFVEMIKSAKSI